MMQRLKKLWKRWLQTGPRSQSGERTPSQTLRPEGPLLRPTPSTDTQKMRIYKAMDMSG